MLVGKADVFAQNSRKSILWGILVWHKGAGAPHLNSLEWKSLKKGRIEVETEICLWTLWVLFKPGSLRFVHAMSRQVEMKSRLARWFPSAFIVLQHPL